MSIIALPLSPRATLINWGQEEKRSPIKVLLKCVQYTSALCTHVSSAVVIQCKEVFYYVTSSSGQTLLIRPVYVVIDTNRPSSDSTNTHLRRWRRWLWIATLIRRRDSRIILTC